MRQEFLLVVAKAQERESSTVLLRFFCLYDNETSQDAVTPADSYKLEKMCCFTSRDLGDDCVRQGHVLYNRPVQKICPVRSDLEEVRVEHVKGT